MNTVYYDGQELKKKILNFLYGHFLYKGNIKNIEFKTFIPKPDLETYKNKYRLLYGKEFEEIEILENKKLVINILSNDDKVHLKGSLNGLFDDFSSLISLDLSSFDTSNITDMSHMFKWCNNLKDLDITSFNTSKVEDMSYMFSRCYNIKILDLSSFNTNNVLDMSHMFEWCNKLSTLKTNESRLLQLYNSR